MGTALITGASSGLGVDFAKLFAADGHDVVLVARRRDRLEALAAELTAAHRVRAEVLPIDLESPDAVPEIVRALETRGLTIEFLVNNAGFGLAGAFGATEAARERSMIAVNVTAVTMLTHALLPGMRARKRGRILNIGSTAGFQPGPFMATYYATKAYVSAWSQALSYELKGTGVTCTLSCPGATATEFGKVADMGGSRLFRLGAMSSSVVTKQAYRAMHAGRRVVVHGLRNKLGALQAPLVPNAVMLPLVAALNQDPAAAKRLTSG